MNAKKNIASLDKYFVNESTALINNLQILTL